MCMLTSATGLTDIIPELRKGALIAQDPTAFESVDLLDESDRVFLREETTHKWRQPKMLYYMVVMSSLAAAVQGMDEAVINGAQILYPQQFGIADDPIKIGIVNSAPYLCCAVIGCWLTDPLNQWLGRKKTIFLTCAISFLTCLWSSFTNTWWHLFIARFFLGFGIGPKSATVPVYSAECSPAIIRGALVMMWQMWTAFGIALGDLLDVAFYFVPSKPGTTGLNWRLMLGSAGIPALLVCCQVLFAPESPRLVNPSITLMTLADCSTSDGSSVKAATPTHTRSLLACAVRPSKRRVTCTTSTSSCSPRTKSSKVGTGSRRCSLSDATGTR